MFCRKNEEDAEVSRTGWAIQKLARFSIINVVFFYIICFPLTLQTRFTAHLARDVLGKRWDLGSIPRSPICLIIFILTCSSVALIQWFTIHAHAKACQVARRSHPKARTWIPGCTSVKPHTHDQKSQARPCLLGQNCSKNTSLWAWKPPLVCIFLNFLFFSFSNSFNYFYLIHLK